MSEQLKHASPEITSTPEANERQKENLEKLQEAGKKAEQAHANVEVDSLLKSAEAHAISGKEVTVGEGKESSSHSHNLGTQRELKAEAYKKTLKKTQAKLKAPDRVLSKVIHQPVVDAISTIGGKTVARPSGILGGSIFALVGSTWFLYMANHVGFTYNYLVFFLLLAAGFILGLLVELLFKSIQKLRS